MEEFVSSRAVSSFTPARKLALSQLQNGATVVRRLARIALSVGLLSSSALAQSTGQATGSVQGVVSTIGTNGMHAVVPAAKVSLETRRAVTTVSGATKLNGRIQLLTPEGRQVLEHVVAGNVRFIGSNLRATHNLAHSVAATLKRSTLPQTAGVVPEQETGKVSAFQITCC
jgi:hypothetical protein